MENNSKLYFVHCLTPVHVGSGQGVGHIDLPIIRERVTEWPFIPGSSMKGVFRDYFSKADHKDKNWLDIAFGKASGKTDNDGKKEGNAGSLVLSDGRLLAFPVASRYGTFAYVTCPLVIKRLFRDLDAAGLEQPDLDLMKLEQKVAETSITEQQVIVGKPSRIVHENHISIDEFKCKAVEDQAFDGWNHWLAAHIFTDTITQNTFIERAVLVSDEAFQYFVTMCSEVIPRIRIEPDKKTTVEGALWSEEYLPTESILYGLVWSDKIHLAGSQMTESSLLEVLVGETVLQIGGNATVGKGRVRCRFSEGGQV